MLATALCGCGNDSANGDNSGTPTSASDSGKTEQKNGNTSVPSNLPDTYEIATTDPHYIISTPDWKAEGYGNGFALNENGNKKYAIVVACGSESTEEPLNNAFTALYDDTFKGILMQNYRAKYTEYTPETSEVTLKDGSAALLFKGTQPADDAKRSEMQGYVDEMVNTVRAAQ